MPWYMLALVVAQTSPPTLPPPVVMTSRVARPIASVSSAVELSVRVSAPGGTLWQGRLRVSPNSGASYQENMSQAPAADCPQSAYDRTERRTLNLSIYAQDQARGLFRVQASWARPMRQALCGEPGSRTVEVSQVLALEPGVSAVVEGDAGLKVELTRHR